MTVGNLLFKTSFTTEDTDLVLREVEKITSKPEAAGEKTLLFALRSGKNYEKEVYEAYLRGCTVVCGGNAELSFPHIKCTDVRSAYSFAASALNADASEELFTYAVTGTNGKTTVASLIHHIMNFAGVKCGITGTLGICTDCGKIDENALGASAQGMTTPDPEVFFKALGIMKDAGCTCAVSEASSHALALSKLAAYRANVGIFTNLTRDHLDFHRDTEEYFRAKRRLFFQSDVFLVNSDDSYCVRLLDSGALGISASGNKGAYAYADNVVSHGLAGLEYTAHIGGKAYGVSTPMFASYSVFNTLVAVCASVFGGVDTEEACRAVSDFTGAPGRLEKVVYKEGLPCVMTDYAHTPDALEKTLLSLRNTMKKGKVTVVFGCGGDRDRTKRAPMGEIAASLADRVILTEDNSRSEDTLSIISEVLAGDPTGESLVIPDRAQAIREAIRLSDAGDVIAVCGKGHEEYMIDKCGKRYFSDREEIKKAIAEMYGDDAL